MSHSIFVATRKGLFVLQRGDNGKWGIAEHLFIGEPVSMALSDSRSGNDYAALNLGHFGVKLKRRKAGRQEWEECALPTYPSQPEEIKDAAPTDAWTLHQIWSLEHGGHDEPGVLWAGTIPGGLFRSDDHGDSWTLIRSLWDVPSRSNWFGGGYDHPGIHSICVNPHNSRHISVAISCGGIWQTQDGANTWTCLTEGMSADYMPPERRNDPSIQDPHRMVQCSSHPDHFWVQHHNGIYRSTDNCQHWQEITRAKPSNFGFSVAVHPHNPDIAWFVPAVKDACRIPVDARLVVTRTDNGGKSFKVFKKGLPRVAAYDLIYRHGLAVDSSGERLAIGSTTGGCWVSEDQGQSWQCVSAHLPPIYCVRFI